MNEIKQTIAEKLGINKIEDVDSIVSGCLSNSYGMTDCRIEKALYGENIVFEIYHGTDKYALKVHVFNTVGIETYVKLLEV